jgi:hypothetical protein
VTVHSEMKHTIRETRPSHQVCDRFIRIVQRLRKILETGTELTVSQIRLLPNSVVMLLCVLCTKCKRYVMKSLVCMPVHMFNNDASRYHTAVRRNVLPTSSRSNGKHHRENLKSQNLFNICSFRSNVGPLRTSKFSELAC